MNSMPATDASITLAEFLELPEDGYRHEVSRGRLIREPQPNHQHGAISANLVVLLAHYLAQHPIGQVTVASGVLLSREPLTVRGPDVAFFRNERLRDAVADPYFPGAPDLAVEVVSPSNRAADLLDKIAQYFEAGAQLVWVVYPQTRTIAVHYAGGEVSIVGETELLTAPGVLPDFEVRAARLFL